MKPIALRLVVEWDGFKNCNFGNKINRIVDTEKAFARVQTSCTLQPINEIYIKCFNQTLQNVTFAFWIYARIS